MVPKYIQQAILSPELEQEISTSHHSPQFSTFKCAPNPFENLSPKQKEEWMLNRGHMLDHNLSQSSGTPPTEVGENYHDKTPQLSIQPSAKVLKHGFVKRPWTLEEDQKLATFVKREGVGKWKQAATLIFGRTGKQCRERWLNNLNPDVRKGNWTPEEDQIITELYEKYGSKWTQIAKHIPGRTENSIKNRFYCALRNPATVKRRNQIEAMGFERSKLENALTQELKKHSDDLEDCVVKHEPPVSYGAGFDSNCLHDNAQMWAVKEEGEEENTSLLVKEEPQTKSSAIKRFIGNKDKMVNLPVQNEKVTCNVKTETENVLKSTTLQKILLPIDCPVYNNNFFTKNCDDFQANLLNKFSSTPLQRTLGCPDQEIHDHRSAFKVMSANGATQLFRHDIGFKDSSLHNQPKNQAPQMQHYYPPQAHTLPVTLMQNQQQEGLPMCQIQELRIQQQQQQQQQQRQISRLNAFQFQDAPLKALDFSTRTQIQENNCLLMPLKNSHCFSGVSETNLQSLGLEHLMKFEALRRHEETHANRKVDENLANMMRALSNKIERVSLVYTHYMKQIQEAGESHNYTKDETCALFQKVAGLNRWLTQAKGELKKLEAVSHTQKSGSYMNNEMMNTINATTNKRSLIDYDLSGTGWDHIIKKRK